MMRNFGILLLTLGLLGAGVDGFRQRERVRSTVPSTPDATEDVRTANYGTGIPPR
jgi:hypothetical protein